VLPELTQFNHPRISSHPSSPNIQGIDSLNSSSSVITFNSISDRWLDIRLTPYISSTPIPYPSGFKVGEFSHFPNQIVARDTIQGITVRLMSLRNLSIQRYTFDNSSTPKLHLSFGSNNYCLDKTTYRVKQVDSLHLVATLSCGQKTSQYNFSFDQAISLSQTWVKDSIAQRETSYTGPRISLSIAPLTSRKIIELSISTLQNQDENTSYSTATIEELVSQSNDEWSSFLRQTIGSNLMDTLLTQAVYANYIRTSILQNEDWSTLDTWLSPQYVKSWVDNILSAHGDTELAPLKVVEAYTKDYIPKNKIRVLYHKVVSQQNKRTPLLNTYGYIPYDLQQQSVSKTATIGKEDNALSLMATGLNYPNKSKYYHKRSLLYQQLYNSISTDFVGKNSTGNLRTTTTHLDYMGNKEDLLIDLSYDLENLLSLMGGTSRFSSKLDLATNQLQAPNASLSVKSLSLPHLYIPIHKSNRARQKIKQLLNTPRVKQYIAEHISESETINWLIFTYLGLFPLNPISGEYLLSSPNIAKAHLRLSFGKTLEITTENWSPTNYSVKSVYWNNIKLKDYKIHHSQILDGGTLHFVMSE